MGKSQQRVLIKIMMVKIRDFALDRQILLHSGKGIGDQSNIIAFILLSHYILLNP